jgi:hypothetical protein
MMGRGGEKENGRLRDLETKGQRLHDCKTNEFRSVYAGEDVFPFQSAFL